MREYIKNGKIYPMAPNLNEINTNYCDTMINNNNNNNNTIIPQFNHILHTLNENYLYKYFKKEKIKIAVSKNLDDSIDFIDPKIWQCIENGCMLLQSKMPFLFNNNKNGSMNQMIKEPKIKKFNYFNLWKQLWAVDLNAYRKYIEKLNININDKSKVQNMIDPTIIELLQRYKNMSASDLYDIMHQCDKLQLIINEYFKNYDILITPTMPILPRKAESPDKDCFINNGLFLFFYLFFLVRAYRFARCDKLSLQITLF